MAKGSFSRGELVSVDSEAIERKLEALDMKQPEIKKSLKSAVRKSLNIIRSAVRKGAASVTTNPEEAQRCWLGGLQEWLRWPGKHLYTIPAFQFIR